MHAKLLASGLLGGVILLGAGCVARSASSSSYAEPAAPVQQTQSDNSRSHDRNRDYRRNEGPRDRGNGDHRDRGRGGDHHDRGRDDDDRRDRGHH